MSVKEFVYQKELCFKVVTDVSNVLSWLGDRPYVKLGAYTLLLDNVLCDCLCSEHPEWFEGSRIVFRPHLFSEYKKKVCLGKVDGGNIYLSSPSWDCGWYWGFGYLGNNDCHYHIESLKKIEKYEVVNDFKDGKSRMFRDVEFVNLFDGLKRHFDEGTFLVCNDSDIWLLSELFQTFYNLREMAEVLGRGGSHYTTNPLRDMIRDESYCEWINYGLLPKIFDEIYRVLCKYDV